jgi:hypothetical protein
MMTPPTTRVIFAFCLLLAGCRGEAWQADPAIIAAREACKGLSDIEQYSCLEQQALAAFNPEICRLAGIWIDDACLQAVYEAANDPAICDQIYLQGVVPNCRDYYAKFTPAISPAAAVNSIATQAASPTTTPTTTPTPEPTQAPSPTPLYELDISRYDPDIHPPIDIVHSPPLIARAADTVSIVFSTLNVFCMKLPVRCLPEGVLYYTYGDGLPFQSMALSQEIVDEMDSLVARLPAANPKGEPLRYFAEFSVPEAGYTQRYPGAGTIDVFAADAFIPVDLPVENAVQPGDKVLDFFWGYGPDKVLQATYPHYPQRVGPPAMDVADDGRIAIIDAVNERIIIEQDEGIYSSYPMPFTYGFYADLAFDPSGRLMVCDYKGEEIPGTPGPHPYCNLWDTKGELIGQTPLYAEIPHRINEDMQILDYGDSRLVAPFGPQGKANSREAQRDKETWAFPLLYLPGKDPYIAHCADIEQGVAYEVHSASPLGVLTDFERTPQGYLLTFFLGDRMRAVWIDENGAVLKDITLPNSQYSEMMLSGQTAITEDGSLYMMSSTKHGIEVHYAAAP